MHPFHYHALSSLHDPHLLSWLDLYESAFPPEERVPVSYILKSITALEEGRPVGEQLLAVLDPENSLLGLVFTDHSPDLRAQALYYFAVSPQFRSGGLGGQIYQEIIRRSRAAGCRMMVFDLEDPEFCPTLEAQSIARRRIGFYFRQGAQLLEGARSTLRLNPALADTRLRVMVHPLEPVTPLEALAAVRELLNEAIEVTGEVSLKVP